MNRVENRDIEDIDYIIDYYKINPDIIFNLFSSILNISVLTNLTSTLIESNDCFEKCF